MLDHWEVRLHLDLAHNPVAASVIRHDDDGSETVWPSRPGPFDTPQEALSVLLASLDQQGQFVF